MARTPSSMMSLGTIAPDFSLPNTVKQGLVSRDEARGEKGLLVMFICNHCPFVIHLQEQLGSLGAFQNQGIGVVAISANDVNNYPQDAPDKMKIFAEDNRFSFPYLYDESQDIARSYDATCTPDFFLFDKNMACVYRGRYDASSPGNGEAITGNELRSAMSALAEGKDITDEQSPSIGCNIKWK